MRKDGKQKLIEKVLAHIEKDKYKIARMVIKAMIECENDLSDEGIKKTWKYILKEVVGEYIHEVTARRELGRW